MTKELLPLNIKTLPSLDMTVVDTLGLASIIQALLAIEKDVRSDTTRRVYRQDVKHFFTWLYDNHIAVADITRDVMNSYNNALIAHRWEKHGDEQRYKNITINRMFTVARRIVNELVFTGTLQSNPFERKIKGLPVSDVTSHAALSEKQVEQLLERIDTTTIKGKRDYAIVTLLVRTGLRRDECVQLNVGNLEKRQGHDIADIEHGKGNKERIVKVPVDVRRVIQEYEDALAHYKDKENKTVGRTYASDHAPLFISFRRGDHPSLVTVENTVTHEQRKGEARIDVKAIELLVKRLGKAIGVDDLTPHGLRATCITLLLKHGAPIHKVQQVAGHADPRTTERYDKDKFNLDDNAVDVLAFLARKP